MGFTASLHPLSIVDVFHASAARTPDRVAVVEGGRTLTYAQLLAARDPGSCVLEGWLAELCAEPGVDEDRVAAAGMTHRELLLRALDLVVEHAAFDRDGALASPLPFPAPGAYVAATISLWLGATVHLLPPGRLDLLAEGVATGRFQTCFLGEAEFAALEARTGPLPAPAPGFLLALCDGAPGPLARRRLAEWLGERRVAP